ncbi:MAG: hypothetical protein U9R55_06525 [Pseudomonadota bacterium]|jgi:hypothetical protein|nr:hypothetical protein [Pseudomonadota bacterium]
MHLSSEILQALRKLLEEDSALLELLRQTPDVVQGAALLCQAAQQAGLDVRQDDLLKYFAAQAPTVANQALDDGQLDKVAGGMSYAEREIASLFSLGLIRLRPESGAGKKTNVTVGRPL